MLLPYRLERKADVIAFVADVIATGSLFKF